MDNQILFDKLKKDSIENDELIFGLNSEKHNIIGLTILAIIERKYCNEQIIIRLVLIGTLLKDHKLFGLYQIGHMAIAALYLIGDEKAQSKYYELYEELSDDDKYIVDNFIKENISI
ncbi:MAG: hypothetical protein FWF85_07590 [Clostridiales bacterium]|nr:hypothetical protein [Clostridiales bacterium]